MPRVIACIGSNNAKGGCEQPHSTAVDRSCWPTNNVCGKDPLRATDNPGGYPHDPVSTNINGTQDQASLWRKVLLQHLYPQLQDLMKESDFKETQLYLFGEDFGEKAKCKLEAAAALKISVYPSSTKTKLGLRDSYPCKNWGW